MTATENIRLQDVLIKRLYCRFFSFSDFFYFLFFKKPGLLDGGSFVSLSSYRAESPATLICTHIPAHGSNVFLVVVFFKHCFLQKG